jgi:hypothetical protein
MFFNFLPEDLILEIRDFINNNNDMISLRTCCKYFKKIADKWGYIKYINFGMHTNVMNFVNLYGEHRKCIISLNIEHMNYPIPWIPGEWPKKVSFSNCYLGNKFIDPPESKTDSLCIIQTNNYRNRLKINWNKLTKLKYLYVETYDIEFKDLEKCKNLEVLCINLYNKNVKVPDCIQNFRKLKRVLISCKKIDKSLHFVSKNLKVCLVDKNKKFTSDSKLVPKFQLENIHEYVNVSAMENLILADPYF